ncbi:MAG TPA: glycosyltransferase family 9 protein [bacterium]|nr:glycosyltransferase family 9 protein [bacterium]
MKNTAKVLIIKLGYSETLDPQIGTLCSLGDVLRTTEILHAYPDAEITWLTDSAAVPLLAGNRRIARILTLDLITVLQLLGERFDSVINLEKVPGICALADRVNAWHKLGFRLDPVTGRAEAYEHAQEALTIASKDDEKRRNNRCWQEVLFAMLNKPWEKKGYLLGYQPATVEQYDIGFNLHVGPKFPVKAWPAEHWRQLETQLQGRYQITWQQSLDNIQRYIDWINQSRLIISNDSLGLHLAIALNKKVIALIGPTSPTEIPQLDTVRILRPASDRDCIPCFATTCARQDPCMRLIAPARVAQVVTELLA